MSEAAGGFVSQKTSIPSLEDVVWAELVLGPAIKRRRRNERVIDSFANHGWVSHTSRQDEFVITQTGRLIAEKRLSEHWPGWREDLGAFANMGLSPEDATAWNLFRRAQSNQVPRLLTRINRRTLHAWERRHSKVAVSAPSELFANARVTVDEVTRLRLPPHSKLFLHDGATVDCDSLMGIFGEVVIPERAWERIRQFEVSSGSAIISIENKGAFVDFPSVPKATLVFLPGDNTSALQQVISKMRNQPIIHFGDLDPDGINIFETFLTKNIPVQHFVPTYVEEFLITHALPCKGPWPRQDYPSLHPIVSILASRSLWLEHEALVLDHRFEAELESMIQNACGSWQPPA